MSKFEKIIISICTGCAVVLTIMLVIVTMNVIKENKRNRYDVNNDGEVNALDLLKVQKYILNEGVNTNE